MDRWTDPYIYICINIYITLYIHKYVAAYTYTTMRSFRFPGAEQPAGAQLGTRHVSGGGSRLYPVVQIGQSAYVRVRGGRATYHHAAVTISRQR